MFKQLKKTIIFYIVSGILLPVPLLLSLTIDKYDNFLQEISKKLIRVKLNLSSTEAAIREMDTLITRTKEYLPSDFYESSTEGELFSSFDDLTNRLKLAEVSASKIVDKADSISLPVRITGLLKNYTNFVNDTGYLRSLKFPFFEIKSVSLIRKQDKEGEIVAYVVEGELHMPKKDAVEVKKNTSNNRGGSKRGRRKW